MWWILCILLYALLYELLEWEFAWWLNEYTTHIKAVKINDFTVDAERRDEKLLSDKFHLTEIKYHGNDLSVWIVFFLTQDHRGNRFYIQLSSKTRSIYSELQWWNNSVKASVLSGKLSLCGSLVWETVCLQTRVDPGEARNSKTDLQEYMLLFIICHLKVNSHVHPVDPFLTVI